MYAIRSYYEVLTVNGHDVAAIAAGIEQAKTVKGKPALVILDTIKGKGVSFAENVITSYSIHYTKLYE